MKSFALQIGSSWWFHLTTLCSKQLEARWKRHEEKQKNIFLNLSRRRWHTCEHKRERTPHERTSCWLGRQLWKSIFTVIKKMLNKGERESRQRGGLLSTETRYLSYNKVFLVVRARCKTQWTYYSAPCWTVWKHDTRKWWEDINIYQTQKSLAAAQKKQDHTNSFSFSRTSRHQTKRSL